MGHRTWIKIYCGNWLRGSLRQDTPALRGIWADVLALAGDLSYGEDGVIKLAENVGLTDNQIAGILCISLNEWAVAKARLLETVRIRVNQNNTIEVVNWKVYQSEYGRQKPYREGKKTGTKSHKECKSCGYKGLTDEDDCPKCGKKLEKDYTAGKYGHMVKR